MIRNLTILTIISLFASAALAQVLNPDDARKRLHALFAEDWQWFLEQYPEAATLLGDNRYNDRLTDLSPEAIARRKAHEREMLDRVQKINRAELAGPGRDLIRPVSQRQKAKRRGPAMAHGAYADQPDGRRAFELPAACRLDPFSQRERL